MRAWGWVAALSILGSLAYSESLGDVAKRERERRERNKRPGTQTETRVIRDDDLLAAPGKDAKGTYSRGTGSPLTPSASSSGSSGSGSVTEVDAMRAGARQRLESSYADIAATAWSLMQAVQEYQRCVEVPNRRCASQATRVGNLAMSVAAGMENAEEAARQGWLNPGEVRAVRQRYGMDDSMWDRLVRYVQQYRR